MSDRSETIAAKQTANESKKMETRALLIGAASAFGAGLLGAIYYTKRKQAKEANLPPQQPTPPPTQPSTAAAAAAAAATTNSIPLPPKMTPEEYAVAKREARLFALKTLGYGTLLALTGAGVLATAVGYWLDVRNVSGLQVYTSTFSLLLTRPLNKSSRNFRISFRLSCLGKRHGYERC